MCLSWLRTSLSWVRKANLSIWMVLVVWRPSGLFVLIICLSSRAVIRSHCKPKMNPSTGPSSAWTWQFVSSWSSVVLWLTGPVPIENSIAVGSFCSFMYVDLVECWWLSGWPCCGPSICWGRMGQNCRHKRFESFSANSLRAKQDASNLLLSLLDQPSHSGGLCGEMSLSGGAMGPLAKPLALAKKAWSLESVL